MPFKILAHFVGDIGVLREIIPLSSEPSKSCQKGDTTWQWTQFGRDSVTLTHIGTTGSVTQFTDGSLVSDHVQGTFTYQNTTYRLRRTR